VLSIPINDKGVFQALSYEKDYFDDFDLEMAEMLISYMWQVIEGTSYQDELEKNRIWLSQVIENSSVPTFVIDEDHKVTHWNEACENLTGISKDEIIGTQGAWMAFYDEERPVMADLVLDKASERKIEEYYEDRVRQSNLLSDAYEMEDFNPRVGEDGKWIYFTAAPIKNSEGNRIGAIETLEDITKRKKHEQELKKSNEKIKRLHDEVTDFRKCENEGEIYDLMVQASQEILDFEVCGVDIVEDNEFIPKAFSTEIENGFIRRKIEEAGISRKVYEEKESMLIEDRRDVDFSKPVVSDYRSSITIPLGDFGFYQALSTEVSAFDERDLEFAEILVNHATEAINRLKSEKELKRSKEKVERLHKASAELESCQSEDEVYEYGVKAAENILDFDMCGFDAVEGDKFVAKATSSSVPEEGYVSKPIEEGGTSKRTYLNQESFLIKDLTKEEEANPVKSDYRSIISLPIDEYGIFQAVSTEVGHFDEDDLKIAKLLISHVTEALKRIETEEREEFLHSLLRHDVGNKAQITQGYLQLMERHDPQEEIKEHLEKAKRATQNGIEVIEKVRKLRNIEKKDEINEINLTPVIDEVISKYEAQLEEKGIGLERKRCDCTVKAGPLLEELFSNLIENSIRHSNSDEICVHSRTKEDECIVSIEDDGVGISDEMKDKIFEKGFKEGENAGTGLGLYMVKKIAEGYGGSVEVRDSDLSGARFEVRLKKPDV
ncbi:MAG: GAF domain-containing protein, partial [Candidatus Thermoplasmatota archaeon]